LSVSSGITAINGETIVLTGGDGDDTDVVRFKGNDYGTIRNMLRLRMNNQFSGTTMGYLEYYSASVDFLDTASPLAVPTKEWVEAQPTVSNDVTGEPTGADAVVKMVSLTQAEYDAGTPVATTFYIITDA